MHPPIPPGFMPLIACVPNRCVARIWKRGGGFFERVRKVQTTLTRIFIVLETVSHGLSENSDEISKVYSAQKEVVSKKKKFTEIETDFSAEIGNSKIFSAQNEVDSQKKKKKKRKVFTEIETDLKKKEKNVVEHRN